MANHSKAIDKRAEAIREQLEQVITTMKAGHDGKVWGELQNLEWRVDNLRDLATQQFREGLKAEGK